MAHFRAHIQGQRGPASRLGSKKSGISSSTNGWSAGVAVEGHYNEAEDKDIIHITVNGGSRNNSFPNTHLGYVTNGGVFTPSQKLLDLIKQGDKEVPAWVERPPLAA